MERLAINFPSMYLLDRKHFFFVNSKDPVAFWYQVDYFDFDKPLPVKNTCRKYQYAEKSRSWTHMNFKGDPAPYTVSQTYICAHNLVFFLSWNSFAENGRRQPGPRLAGCFLCQTTLSSEKHRKGRQRKSSPSK